MARGGGELSDAELGELAALADGSIGAGKRVRLAARVERSPELRELREQQEAALRALRALDVAAPERLRARVAASFTVAPRRRSLRGWWPAPAAALLAGLAVAVVIVVAGGDPDPATPAIADIASLAAAEPNAPAPRRAEQNLLAAAVDGVAFPDLAAMFGWRTSGSLAGELDGRRVETVTYARGDRRIAYSIVSGEALAWPPGLTRTSRDGIDFRVGDLGGRRVVTWLRKGRTCVISGDGVPSRELLELASWTGEGSIPF